MRVLLLLVTLALPGVSHAQPTPSASAPLTLQQAITLARENYPAIRAAAATVAATAAGVDLARTTYLPRADVLWQMNRATRNSVTGLLLPQPVIAGVSGGIGVNRNESAWNSATGVMLNWEPFDFGARRANVATAESTFERASATATVTDLQVATATAEAFLNVVATEQALRTAAAAVQRARVFNDVVSARVEAGLRPGADAARSRAELATAETQRIVAEQNARVAKVVLAQYTNTDPETIQVDAGTLLELPPDTDVAAPPTLMSAFPPVTDHPLAVEQNAAITESAARLRLVERSYFPRFNVLFNTYARGSGIGLDGTVRDGTGGLQPEVSNWAVGMNVLFPLMDRPALRARAVAEQQRQLAERARFARVIEDLEAQMGRSQALLDGARRAAGNTPFQLAAARANEQQATARYQAGLSDIVTVADAQRLLTQAEIDDSIAKLNVWRGLLLVATAEGRLEPFLQRVQP
jgi:outer membrane protein TolC